MQAGSARQLLATVDASDAASLDYRCRQPIDPANEKYCAALFRTLERCRRLFGRFTLRCDNHGATACSTSLAENHAGRCSAHYPVLDPHHSIRMNMQSVASVPCWSAYVVEACKLICKQPQQNYHRSVIQCAPL